jgi:hypothetical protein
MDDSNLDTAIDDVARQMTAGEPDADFRARVVARIESGFGIRDSGFGAGFGRWRWAVTALGAAAMIVAAVVLFQNSHERRMTETPVAQAPHAPAPPAQVANGTWRPTLAGPPRLTQRPVRREDASNPPSEIDALAPPPLTPFPLDVASIAVGALPPADSIQLDKLETITPIAVTPLGEGDRP